MNCLGKNVRGIREFWGLTQSELGKLIGATRGMIMQYENRGTTPKNETVSKLVALFRTSKDMLFNTELTREQYPEMDISLRVAIENMREEGETDDSDINDEEVKELLTAKPNKQSVNRRNGNKHGLLPTYLHERFLKKLNPRIDPIPNLDIDFAAAESFNVEMHNDKGEMPEDYYYIPEFSGCRAFNCYSDSMEPLIKKGSKIFCKKIEGWQDYLEYGQVYAIGLTDGRRLLKYIKKGSSPDRYLLESENKHYDSDEIPIRLIRSIWIVDGSMDKMTQSTFFILKYPNPNPEPEQVMTYGKKHRGKPMSKVPPDYLRWMYDTVIAKGEKVDQHIIDYIEENVPDIKHQVEKNKQNQS